MKLRFKHPLDTKSFIIGVCASISAVIIWDIIKHRKQIFNYKPNKNE